MSNSDEKRVNELREMLRGYKWSHFIGSLSQNRYYRNANIINNVMFIARAGVFIRKEMIVLIAEDKFVVMTPILFSGGKHNWSIKLVLDPTDVSSGMNPTEALPWTLGDRMALMNRYIIGPINTFRRSVVDPVGSAEVVLSDLAD